MVHFAARNVFTQLCVHGVERPHSFDLLPQNAGPVLVERERVFTQALVQGFHVLPQALHVLVDQLDLAVDLLGLHQPVDLQANFRHAPEHVAADAAQALYVLGGVQRAVQLGFQCPLCVMQELHGLNRVRKILVGLQVAIESVDLCHRRGAPLFQVGRRDLSHNLDAQRWQRGGRGADRRGPLGLHDIARAILVQQFPARAQALDVALPVHPVDEQVAGVLRRAVSAHVDAHLRLFVDREALHNLPLVHQWQAPTFNVSDLVRVVLLEFGVHVAHERDAIKRAGQVAVVACRADRRQGVIDDLLGVVAQQRLHGVAAVKDFLLPLSDLRRHAGGHAVQHVSAGAIGAVAHDHAGLAGIARGGAMGVPLWTALDER